MPQLPCARQLPSPSTLNGRTKCSETRQRSPSLHIRKRGSSSVLRDKYCAHRHSGTSLRTYMYTTHRQTNEHATNTYASMCYIHISLSMYIYTQPLIYVYVCIYIYIHTQTHVCVCARKCAYLRELLPPTWLGRTCDAGSDTCHLRVSTHVYIYTHIHICTHMLPLISC